MGSQGALLNSWCRSYLTTTAPPKTQNQKLDLYGFYPIMLAGGLFLALIVVSGVRLHRIVLVEPLGQLRYAVAFFVLAAATQESFFMGTHFLWALLVWALVPTADEISREERRRQPDGPPAAVPSGR